jgi:uncharacterized protein YggE
MLISVRGEAELTVPPDYCVQRGTLTAVEATKADALRAVAGSQFRLIADLTALGAVALTAATERAPLTWSAESARTEFEQDPVKTDARGKFARTGRTIATVYLSIAIRDFERLDPLATTFAGHESFTLNIVNWQVDHDNPSWPIVRAAAIQNAIGKGRDYAAALGGRLDELEHLADSGLLGGDADSHRRAGRSVSMGISAMAFGGGGDTPSLDPVPQELSATVDARFLATVPPL